MLGKIYKNKEGLMKKTLVFVLVFMLAFLGCSEFHKAPSLLPNNSDVKDTAQAKPSEHYTVGDALHFAVSSYFTLQKAATKTGLIIVGSVFGIVLITSCCIGLCERLNQ